MLHGKKHSSKEFITTKVMEELIYIDIILIRIKIFMKLLNLLFTILDHQKLATSIKIKQKQEIHVLLGLMPNAKQI